MFVRDVKKLLRDPVKISELPDIIQYTLPQQLKGLRDHVPSYDTITEEQFPEFFKSLEEMWNFLDCDFMVKKYGKLEHHKKCENYERNIEHFCSDTSISDLIKHWKPRFVDKKIPSELKPCVMEFS